MRKLCEVPGCSKRQSFLGECKFCRMGYCQTHFQPESHLCKNMTECRQSAFEKNKKILLTSAHIAPKIRT
ncbi:polyubiquitin [Golden Marseillevirus]|uniref:polyubiquitin n=1 Tax=Golden Marseillevirus TaxID=1720526 RepID=UPI000877AB55|nr:polyubiquitin [Golden Marseillevirus]ALX27514.1 polyubiquitin [Golden Marseillevirus]